MARYQFPAFKKSTSPRYIAVFDLQWKIISCARLDAGADLSGEMAAATARLELEGWHPEGSSGYSLFSFATPATGDC